jgi:uncharacterized protein (TIGR02246 family)
MKLLTIFFFAVVLTPAFSADARSETAIKNVLNIQVQAWNRGDLESFVASYAEDCTFVAKQVVQGRPAVLARYRANYSNKPAMGKLTFEELSVRTLDGHVAIVTGKFHLDRTVDAGGPTAGIFSLVMQQRNGSWQIVLDHTS